MAYRTGTITNLNPAASLATEIENTFAEQGGAAWAATTAYGGAGQTLYVRGVNTGVTYIFEATTAGTSGGSEPTWPTTLGNTVTDGSVTWTNRGLQTWVFIEEVTISTVSYRVWKSRGSGCAFPNAHGTDFFIAIKRTTTAGIALLEIQAFESWDATNKKAIRPVAGTQNSQAINANFSFGDETNGFLLSSTSIGYVGVSSLPTTGYEYYVAISKDTIIMGVKYSTTDLACYIGLFEPLPGLTAAHPFPLCVLRSSSASGNFSAAVQGGVSRHPTVTGTNTGNFQHNLLTTLMANGSDTTNIDKLHGYATVVRIGLVPASGSSFPQTYGYLHGMLYNCGFLGGGSWRNGDTLPMTAPTENWVRLNIAGTATIWVDTNVT